jgi:hypothetical protein
MLLLYRGRAKAESWLRSPRGTRVRGRTGDTRAADDEARCGRRSWVLRRLHNRARTMRRRGGYAGAMLSEWLRGGSGRGETMPTRLQL